MMTNTRIVALVRDDTIVNNIVVDDSTPPGFLDDLVKANKLDRTVDTTPGDGTAIGHVYKTGRGYVPPVEVDVEANRLVITDNRPTPAVELDVTTSVAGGGHDEHTVPVNNGTAIVNVPQATPDAPVTVDVPELGITATVHGPPPAKAATAR